MIYGRTAVSREMYVDLYECLLLFGMFYILNYLYLSVNLTNDRYFTFLSIYRYTYILQNDWSFIKLFVLVKDVDNVSMQSGRDQGFLHGASPSPQGCTPSRGEAWRLPGCPADLQGGQTYGEIDMFSFQSSVLWLWILKGFSFRARRPCARSSAGRCWSLPCPLVLWVNGRAS